MKHSSKVIASLCMAGLMTLPALGEGRLFLVTLGTNPNTATPGSNFDVTVTNFPAHYTINIGVYADVNPNEELKATQVSLPCSVPCSGGGAVNFVSGTAAYDASRTDDLAEGYLGATFPATDQGTCGGVGGLPRVAIALAGPPLGPAIPVMTDIRYVGTFQYSVENACVGTATIVVPNEPDSAMRDENNMPIIFTTDGMDITVPLGQCCDGVNCLGELTRKACLALSPTNGWDPAKTCADPCQCTSNADCNDGNACTNNVCGPGGQCQFPSNVPAGQCCDPADGSLAAIDDNNECTADSCDAQTGIVTNDAAAQDGAACTDDGNPCTLDNCLAGACAHNDITAIPCVADAECVAASGGASQTCGNLAAGFCDCVANPPISIECEDGDKPNGECFNDGDKVVMKVVLGGGTLVINGGQFQLDYNPACLDFNFATPGSVCDPSSPFTTEIFEQVNEATGEIFYAVGIDLLQNGGTNDGGVLACLSFTKICSAACEECDVCFVPDNNPQHTYLSGPGGQLVVPDFPNGGCGCEVRCNGENTISVPEGGAFNADCDSPTAIVTWSSPAAASNSCDGAIDLTCTCTHTNPLVTSCGHLIANGGEFPQGTAEFCCTGTDECGLEVSDCWTVYVSDQTTMDVVVQLSPTMTPNQFTRCIEFGFYANCVEAPEIFKEEMVFGPPYDFPGHATYDIKVPKGQYECITARDQAHTLRSASSIECLGNGHLSAEFKGDPFFGGNWLIGGNLDGSHVIDILDFGVLVSLYLKPGDVNNTCDDIKVDGYRDADINADGIVDALDYAFIQGNFLAMDKEICGCDFPGAGAPAAGITSITVQELRAMGLGDLAAGDVNHDGVLDTNDMEAFQQGLIPAPAHNNPPKKASRR